MRNATAEKQSGLSASADNAECIDAGLTLNNVRLRKDGYYVIRGRGGMLAHRHVYTECFGLIQDRLGVLHRCDNPSCVNPEHLFLGTQRENILDMWRKERRDSKGEKHPGAKLTDESVRQIRKMIAHGWSQRAIAKEFQVSQSLITAINKVKLWTHI